MDELPLTFFLPKTDSLKQMSFHSFFGDRGSFHYIFYQHHGYAVLYILQPRLFELIDHWHFAVVLCDANFNCRRWQRALFSKYSHLPPPSTELVWGADWPRGHSLPHDHLKDDILSRPSSVVSMGECRQRSGQLSPVSICAAWCLHCHTNRSLLFFTPPLPVSVSLSSTVALMHTHDHKPYTENENVV